MGNKSIHIKLPTSYDEKLLKKKISKIIRTDNFSYVIENKSLDARNKKNIHWQLRILVTSSKIKDETERDENEIEIRESKNGEPAIVIGSGPAGFFAALVLQLSGYSTTIIERGTNVATRTIDIESFESTGNFNPNSNYAYGEGGAGTFSDGKLTSRSKHISREKNFILQSYVQAGAPDEIMYMTHPHIGSDNLKVIVANLRQRFENIGGRIMFNTAVTDIITRNGVAQSVVTDNGIIDASVFLFAPGHSSFDTCRMLMKRGVLFRPKNFALGSRMEHYQEIINIAQWGVSSLPGVKAAEYRLTSKGNNREQVYSFCMCPGGMVVPAAATRETNIVNGMSRYMRDNNFANAACVATVNLGSLLGKEVTALETINWLEDLERSFYNFTGSYKAPICSIQDFLHKKLAYKTGNTSYPLGVEPAPLWEMLPSKISEAMRFGLTDFIKKMRGFGTGNIMGLESKTSSPIQALREPDGRCTGYKNLYIIGEGSGYAGGIISSGADGVRIAMNIINTK